MRTLTIVLALTFVFAGVVKAETARERQHRIYKADKELMAREHEIEMERKSGKLTHDDAIKQKKEALETAKKAHDQH